MRLPLPWRSQEERDETRFHNGRQGAFARGMRQAANRDLPASDWRPGPVPPPRQARRQDHEVRQRQDSPAADRERAKTLARAMDQSARRRTR